MDEKSLTTATSDSNTKGGPEMSATENESSITESSSTTLEPTVTGSLVDCTHQCEPNNSSLTIPNEAPTPSAAKPTRGQPVQNDLLIWLDAAIDASDEDCERSLAILRRTGNTVNTYVHVDECVSFIDENQNEKILLITSGSLGMHVVPCVHGMSQIDSIYIFCSDKSKHKQWTQEWTKVKGVFTDILSLCEALQPDSTSTPVTHAHNTDELEPTFMYTTLLKECILEIEYDDDEIEKMTDGCREVAGDTEKKLRVFDEFKAEYYLHSPIWWYTRTTFIYQTLNRALRMFDTSTIVTMGFFIQALHRRIEQLYFEQRHLFTEKFVVYRGQGLLTTDFNKLCTSYGGLLSFNSFLSTSIDRESAFYFACASLGVPDHVAVLFKMTVDPSVASTPFADIGGESYYGAQEETILFAMNSVFRLGAVRQVDSNKSIFEVELVRTSNNDGLLSSLTNKIRNEISGGTAWHRLGKLLLQSGDPKEAETIYQQLLQSSPEADSTEVSALNHQLGAVHREMGKYPKAFKHYERGLEIRQQSLPLMHPDLAASYNSIGRVYADIGEYSKGLEYYEKGLHIREQSLPPAHPDLATSYNYIGQVYADMGEYAKALEYYQKGLRIRKQSLPPTHPSVAASYNCLGKLYRSMKNYPKALEYFEATLRINIKALTETHPHLAITYSNIGDVHRWTGETNVALSLLEKALALQTSVTCDPISLAWTCNYLGETYCAMKEYRTALEYHEKARQIREKSLPATHPTLAQTQHSLAKINNETQHYRLAYEHAQRAVKIARQSLPEKHPDLLAYTETASELQKKLHLSVLRFIDE